MLPAQNQRIHSTQLSAEEREKLREKVIKNVRAVLLPEKHGMLLDKLNREYQGLIGERIPWVPMGYPTLDDFVDQNPTLFKVEYKMDGPWVHAKADAQSQHIKNMVSAQRTKRPKSRAKPARRPMQLLNWQPPNRNFPFRALNQRHSASGRPLGNSRPRQQFSSNPPIAMPGGAEFQAWGNAAPFAMTGGFPITISNLNNNQARFERSFPPPPGILRVPNKTNIAVAKLQNAFTPSQTYSKNAYEKKHQAISSNQTKAKETTLNPIKICKAELAKEEVGTPKIPNIDIGVINRVIDMLKKRSNGVWSRQIEVEYQRSFKEQLPAEWTKSIECTEYGQEKLSVKRPSLGGQCLISLRGDLIQDNIPSAGNLASNQRGLQDNDFSRPAQQFVQEVSYVLNGLDRSTPIQSPPPALKMPDEMLWDVYVTYVHSTVDVCVRLFGDTTSVKYDELVARMDTYYSNTNNAVVCPRVGQYYAAYLTTAEEWQRVEILRVRGIDVSCYFIDHGDEDELNVADLKELPNDFLALAPQAKHVRLAGLEDFRESTSAIADLTSMALGRSLVGGVHTNDNDGVSLVLWDTSGQNEDININETLLQKSKGYTILEDEAKSIHSSMPSLEQSPDSQSSVININSKTIEKSPPKDNPLQHNDISSTSELARSGPARNMISATQTNAEPASDIKELIRMDLSSFKPLTRAVLPDAEDFFDVTITLAGSPSNFTVQPYNEGKSLETLQKDLNKFYNNPENNYDKGPLTSSTLSKDYFFAGKHDDGQWYRVKVNSMLDEYSAAVKLVDYGDYCMMQLENMQPLWPQFRHLSMQAISASLADIEPSNGSWTGEDAVYFNELVIGKPFVSQVKDIYWDSDELENFGNGFKLVISLFDTSSPETDIQIEEVLVKAGRARKVAAELKY